MSSPSIVLKRFDDAVSKHMTTPVATTEKLVALCRGDLVKYRVRQIVSGGARLYRDRVSQEGHIHRGEIALCWGMIATSLAMSRMTRRVASRPIAISSSAR
jgi:hypothetical protein